MSPLGCELSLINGINMAVYNKHDIVSTTIQQRRFWEIRSPTEVCGKDCDTSGLFVDVGMNIGYYSLLFAHFGYNVLAIEPMIRNQKIMNVSLCLNPTLRNKIKIIPNALISPYERGLQCCITPTNDEINIGNGYLKCNNYCKKCGKNVYCHHVNTTTLDQVIEHNNVNKIDVMKMDIETHECQVLQGAHNLLRTSPPNTIKMEVEWENGWKCAQNMSKRYHYSIKRYGPDAILRRLK